MNIYTILKEAHSGLAYLVLLGLLVSVVYYFLQYFKKDIQSKKSKTIALVTMIIVHLQFLFGFILYFVSPLTKAAMQDFGAAMKSEGLRFQAIEHPLTMLIVVILVTIAHKKIKTAAVENTIIKWLSPAMFLLALIAALSMIPWDVWPGN